MERLKLVLNLTLTFNAIAHLKPSEWLVGGFDPMKLPILEVVCDLYKRILKAEPSSPRTSPSPSPSPNPDPNPDPDPGPDPNWILEADPAREAERQGSLTQRGESLWKLREAFSR